MLKKIARRSNLRWLYKTKLSRLFSIIAVFLVVAFGLLSTYQNVHAAHTLARAKHEDDTGKYEVAGTELQGINRFLVTPGTRAAIQREQARNVAFKKTQDALNKVQALIRQGKIAEAQKLLASVQKNSTTTAGVQQQVNALHQTITQQTKTTSGMTTPVTSGGSTSGSPGGGSGGGGGTPTPALSAITVNSFSATTDASSSTTCGFHEALNFSVNGSGSVAVEWYEYSTKTSSSVAGPYTHTFTSAGSQTDTGTTPGSLEGLQAGDSYRISATITSTTNSAITTSAGPIVITSCGVPESLMTQYQQSFMSSSVVPGATTVTEYADPQFAGMCTINPRAAYSVSGPGSIQVVYLITSPSSIGATLFSLSRSDFSGPGSGNDNFSYIRMPHLPAGQQYTISAQINVLGDPSHSAAAASITTNCD